MSQLLLFLLILNFLLIGIVNPGMLNPDPGSLKICYQNVQGLIPIKDLTLKQPSKGTSILTAFRGLCLKIWEAEITHIRFLLNPLMRLGSIDVFQDLPMTKVELLT